MPINTMGCHFFTTGTQLVHTSSTAASAIAGRFSRPNPAASACSSAMGTTEMPAAATSAVEAGAYVAELIETILKEKASGVDLKH